jgi:hypothetical protein
MNIKHRKCRLALVLLLAYLPILVACSGVRTVAPPASTPSTSSSGELSSASGILSGSGTSGPGALTGSVSGDRQDAEHTVEQFVRETDRNAWAMTDKYKNGFVKITGTVADYYYGIKDDAYLFLKEGGQHRFLCRDKMPSTKVLIGQTVTLRGQAAFDITWDIVKVAGQGPPEMTAEQLAMDLAADEKATNQKWKDKWLVLTCQIAETTAGGLVLTPKGKTPRINCWYWAAGPSVKQLRDQAFKAGTKVKLIGKWEGSPITQLGTANLVEVLP